MSFLDSSSKWSDPALLAALQQACNATWSAICAHKDGSDKSRMAELTIAVSRGLLLDVCSSRQSVDIVARSEKRVGGARQRRHAAGMQGTSRVLGPFGQVGKSAARMQ
jgi:hypothetical protein